MATVIERVVKSPQQRRIISSAGLRLFSSQKSEDPDFCYMLCAKGLLVYPGYKFLKLDDFFGKNPFLSPIPSSGLYSYLSRQRPYMLEDPVRLFINSGSLAPYVANRNNIEFSNLFFKGNVGVHKDTGLACFKKLGAFRSISYQSSKGYQQFSNFLKDLIKEYHGLTVLSQTPLDLDVYFNDLEDKQVTEDFILDHPAMFSNSVYADVFTEAFWVLVKDLMLTDKLKAERMLEVVGRQEPKCLQTVLQNGLLPQFLPFHLQQQYPALKFPFATIHPRKNKTELEDGKIVIHVTRHGYVHCRDQRPLTVVQNNFPVGTSYTRLDVLKLARISFPNSGRSLVKSFEVENLLPLLKIRERKPVPSISLNDPFPTFISLATL